MEQLMRNTFLYLAKSQSTNRLAKRYGMRLGANRFVAGDTIQSAVAAIKQLNSSGILATIDHLGEFVGNEEEAVYAADFCIQTLDAIHESKVQSHMSVKLTQLGLDISKDLCLYNMRKILGRAEEHNNFVRIDMEDFQHNAITLDVFKTLRREFGTTVGLVIQAYLYKSAEDLVVLNEYHPNLRLVKGAYKEPESVAFPNKEDVDGNFVKLIRLHLENGNYTAVATHDEKVIDLVKKFVSEKGISKSQFEFQMLYGIRNQLQLDLAQEGYTVRVYVPYGDDWYGYFMRRLAERPANVGFVLKSLMKS